LELIKEVVPKVSRVAVLGNPAEPQHKSQVSEAEGASRTLGLTLQVLQARSPNEFDRAFAAMVQHRAGALLVLSGPVYVLHRGQLADLAAKRRLPAIYNFREFADAGGLLAYGPNIRGFWRRAATYVDISKHAGRVNGESIVVEQLAARSSAHLLGWTTARIPRYALGGERRS